MSVIQTECPICAYTLAAPFFDGGMQPLATLGWPASVDEAQSMARLPHDFVQCTACTHVWNRSFRYDAIPYKNNPNRMFNRGGIWRGHLATTRDLLLTNLPEEPTVVEIGCGEGHFVRGISEQRLGRGRFVGFDPNASSETGIGVEFHARLFEPLVDMQTFAPDAIVIRHVLEHLIAPAALLDQLAWGAANLSKPCWLFAEMPCIDRVFETHRLADFFYEHVAHFTSRSFRTLMSRAGEVTTVGHGYDGEVVYALVKLGVAPEQRACAANAQEFAQRADISRETIRTQLTELANSDATVVIWGGTGKAAAFIHQFGADARRFPLVVDSDPDKAGTFVPGTGQQIRFRDSLKGQRIDVIIVPTQWRAKDIALEMQQQDIRPAKVLIEHKGRLVDFWLEAHPYR